MTHADVKIDLGRRLASNAPVVVEIGCGSNKPADRIGIDLVDLAGVDIVADLNLGLPFLPDASVDEIHSSHVLEHIREFELLMKEIERVTRPGGRIFIRVPHFSNPYYYSDYTHVRFLGLYTFFYFVDTEHQLRRKVPTFYSTIRFRVESIKLEFRSHFKPIHLVKRQFFERLVNLSSWTQMLYEENFAYIIPCYELSIVLVKPDGQI